MAAMSDFLENKLIDFLFRGQALGITGATAAAGTGPTALFFGLVTAASGDAAAGTEVIGGSYARVSVAATLANFAGTQAAASIVASTGSSGTTSNNAVITFPTPTAAWGVVIGLAVFDAVSGGNLLLYAALGANKTINNGDPAPTFPAAAFTLQIDN